MRRPSIFLSYAREDYKEVAKVHTLLQQSGYAPWLDTEDILGGEDWEQKITSILKASDFYVVFISDHSVKKDSFFQREVQLALNYNNERDPDKIFFIPAFLDNCPIPENLNKFNKIDLFRSSGMQKLLQTLAEGVRRTGQTPPVLLRKEALDTLTEAEAIDAIKRLSLFDNTRNPNGVGLPVQYEIDEEVITNPVSGLMWQKSGSLEIFPYEGLMNISMYIKLLNREVFAGYDDWRLPTLEEAMALMTRKNQKTKLYAPFIFDVRQEAIATCDTFSYDWNLGTFFWIALFTQGDCQCLPANEQGKCWVRAVRSTW